jgi:hypothetical protein
MDVDLRSLSLKRSVENGLHAREVKELKEEVHLYVPNNL